MQNIIEMHEGGDRGALKLTTASYWRPSEKNIHRFPNSTPKDEWGVKPNDGFEIKLSDEERQAYYKDRRERDVVRRNGAKPPEKKEEKDKDGKAKKSEPFKDRVMEKALEYIRGELKKDDKQGAQAPAAPPQHREPPAEDESFDASAHLQPSALPARDAVCDRTAGNGISRERNEFSRFSEIREA